MIEQDHQLLSRYIDGELSLIERRAVEKRLDSEPALQAQLDKLEQVQALLGNAFPVAPQDKRLDEIASLLETPQSTVVPFPGQREKQAPRRQRQFAMAASLAAAIGVVALQGVQTGVQGLSVAQFLESTPSSGDNWTTLEDGNEARALLSFQNNEGGWCREYISRGVGNSAGNSLHAVACRENQEWIVKVASETGLLGNSELYQPASAADTDTVAHFIDREARDIPLDATTEQRLIESDWQ
jgi:hypothetical protein